MGAGKQGRIQPAVLGGGGDRLELTKPTKPLIAVSRSSLIVLGGGMAQLPPGSALAGKTWRSLTSRCCLEVAKTGGLSEGDGVYHSGCATLGVELEYNISSGGGSVLWFRSNESDVRSCEKYAES